MFKNVIRFFDGLEDEIRIALSHTPILYALIGAVGIVLVWKGVWETAGYFSFLYGPVSIVLGVLILLMSGLLVSFFIGDGIIMSGFKREKKFVEKTENEVRAEREMVQTMAAKLDHIERDVHALHKEEEKTV